jgi:biopolymer transport protein ExbD
MVALLALMVFPPIDLPLGTAVDSAKVSHPTAMPHALREDALVVVVMNDGKIWLNHTPLDPHPENLSLLTAAIQDGIQHGAEKKVYVRADAHVRYTTVKLVVNAIRAAGIEDIAFLVDERKSSPETITAHH